VREKNSDVKANGVALFERSKKCFSGVSLASGRLREVSEQVAVSKAGKTSENRLA